MSDVEVLPELKEIVGAVLFSARQPVTAEHLLQVFGQTAERIGGFTRDYAAVTAADIPAAVEALRRDLEQARVGLRIAEVAQGYRMESQPGCGAWLRVFLDRGRPQRLTPPALETLAIIAYRQPIMRSEIEAVRGVAVDQILRNLLDMQLIRIAGRSDLPGRPWLFGTSQHFLEHFGLKSLDDLPGTDELRRRDEAKAREAAQRQLDLEAGGSAGETTTGFKPDIDADTPGQEDVIAKLSVADQEDPGDLPDSLPAGSRAVPPDETDAIRAADYEDDERIEAAPLAGPRGADALAHPAAPALPDAGPADDDPSDTVPDDEDEEELVDDDEEDEELLDDEEDDEDEDADETEDGEDEPLDDHGGGHGVSGGR